MNPEEPNNDGWSMVDIAEMLTTRDAAEHSSHSFEALPVELSGGHHPGDGEYVVDPDYAEILSLDYESLVSNQRDLRR